MKLLLLLDGGAQTTSMAMSDSSDFSSKGTEHG
jgi:hypothetical protein